MQKLWEQLFDSQHRLRGDALAECQEQIDRGLDGIEKKLGLCRNRSGSPYSVGVARLRMQSARELEMALSAARRVVDFVARSSKSSRS